ncbi:MAG: S-methyl-5'-thioinosine phosphorylase [Gammaproteobacteria bacterium]|nr:S-methyl-5'-thioinosine phosphorylase [Gammaproteobacteria bacterium]
MSRVALIGGTGALGLVPDDVREKRRMDTPYGPPSGPVMHWMQGDTELLFLPRHGSGVTIPPHCVNYQANIWALHELEPDWVLGINAVGGIHAAATPGRLVFPDQLIDYTWGRAHSFVDAMDVPVRHVDFTLPISAALHERLATTARQLALDFMPSGVYGVTQGPRLESAAEIDRLERDGCDVVGMTAMPEAGLARELGLDYAICAVVVNFAAGRGSGGDIHAEIEASMEQGMRQVATLLPALLPH